MMFSINTLALIIIEVLEDMHVLGKTHIKILFIHLRNSS